jgi:hypothetical protein
MRTNPHEQLPVCAEGNAFLKICHGSLAGKWSIEGATMNSDYFGRRV